jgi:hypothetical protein
MLQRATAPSTGREDVTGAQSRVPRLSFAEAVLALVAVDVILRLRGYATARSIVGRCAASNASPIDRQLCQATVAAVDRAATCYPRRLMCLERSLAIAWLLRRRGVNAQLVIGCRHTPFYAHAWVEHAGEVINDRASVAQKYPEMERV